MERLSFKVLPSADARQRFLRLFEAHRAELRAYVWAALRDAPACDDILQDIALVLWRKFDSYDPERPFGAWARGVAVKEVLKAYARRRRDPVLVGPETIDALTDAFDRLPPPGEGAGDALRSCVEKLPVKSRRLVDLRFREALKFAEIAQRIVSSEDAVRMALVRIKLALRDCLRRRIMTDA